MPKPIIAEGTIADNDQGESLVYRGGKWFPYQEGSPTSAPVTLGTEKDKTILQKYRDGAQSSLYAAEQARKFIPLNAKAPTGGLNMVGFPWQGGGSIGDLRAGFNPELAEMKAITSRVAPQNRVEGSGASSDKDVGLQISGFPNINTPGPANVSLAKEWHEKSDHDAALAAFADTWFAKRGSLMGMPQAFNAFWSERKAGRSEVAKARKTVGLPPRKPAPAPVGPTGGFKIVGVR